MIHVCRDALVNCIYYEWLHLYWDKNSSHLKHWSHKMSVWNWVIFINYNFVLFCPSCGHLCVYICVCVKDIGLQKIHPIHFFYKVFINKTFVTFVICDCWILFNPIRPPGFSCKAHMQIPLCGQGRYTDQWSQSPAEMDRLLCPPV